MGRGGIMAGCMQIAAWLWNPHNPSCPPSAAADPFTAPLTYLSTLSYLQPVTMLIYYHDYMKTTGGL